MQETFKEIQKCFSDENHEHALNLVNKILEQDPGDFEAIHCKVVALIKTDKHQEALDVLLSSTTPSELATELYFEKAYCYYRIGDSNKCLEMLNKKGDADLPVFYKHLKAQMKQDQFNDAAYINAQIQKEIGTDDPYYDELRTNSNALSALLSEDVSLDITATEGSTYEMIYNLACVRLAEGKIDEAIVLLEKAKVLCREFLQEDDAVEADIEKEMNVILVQLAYSLQLIGKLIEALEIYNFILKTKVTDKIVNAVASNNILSIKKNLTLLESTKLFRASSSAILKFNASQKRAVAMNSAIFSSKMNKHNSARDASKKLLETYHECDIPYLIIAGVAYRQKRKDKSLNELKGFLEKQPQSLLIRLAVAQLYIIDKEFMLAKNILEEYMNLVNDDQKYKPALISLLVWLYGETDDVSTGVELLEAASEYWKERIGKNDPSIIEQFADFKMLSNRYQEAAIEYENLAKSNPSNLKNIAKLVLAYSEFDLSLAEKYIVYFPAGSTSVGTAEVIDVDSLEKGVGIFAEKKKIEHSKNDRIKKKPRKKRLPKNYDPNVKPDPERWLALRDRSTYKSKKAKGKDLSRGPQGSSSSIAAGGMGATGSANIANLKGKEREEVTEEATPVAVGAKKKKKGKR